jgi:hypothetical protein
MADVITRFKLETTQYDSKLRDASKGLAEYTRQATQAGNEFGKFTQKNVEAARALGSISPSATNAKDKVKELVGAFNEAAKAYNALTKEQQQSDFGKAMAESISQLSGKIREAKQELYDMGDAAKKAGSGGLFGALGDKMSGAMQVFAGNMMTKGFDMIASGLKDTWTQSIELAKAGEGVRLAFERLNQPGLLDRLKEATHGTVSEVELMKQAIKFDNFKLPLEDLATYLAFAQQKAKDTGESVDYMVNSITTGLGRQSKQILDNLGISAAELTRRMNEGADMTKAVADIIREEMAKAGDYVETAADKAAQAAARATDEMEKFGQSAVPIAEEWGQVWNALSIGAMDFANTLLGPLAESIRSLQNIWNNGWEDNIINSPFNIEGKGKPKFGYQGMGDLQKVQAPGGYVEVTDKNTGAVIGGQHFDNLSDTNSINAWKKGLVKTPKTGGSGKKNMPEYADFSKLLFKNGSQDLKAEAPFTSVFSMLKDKSEFDPENILGSKSAWEDYKDAITGSIETIGDSMDNLTEWTKNFDPYTEKMNEMTKAAKQQQMAFGMAGQAAENLGAALSSMDDPAARAAGTVISAIANIALGFGQAVASAGSMGPWAWLAYVAAGTAALATTISTVHSLTGYAEGGMIKGNSYSGDNIGGLVDGSQFVGLNAGEVVLNASQQNMLAQNLQGGGGTVNVAGRLVGEDIFLSADRYARRSGRGGILTGKNL